LSDASLNGGGFPSALDVRSRLVQRQGAAVNSRQTQMHLVYLTMGQESHIMASHGKLVIPCMSAHDSWLMHVTWSAAGRCCQRDHTQAVGRGLVCNPSGLLAQRYCSNVELLDACITHNRHNAEALWGHSGCFRAGQLLPSRTAASEHVL